MKLAVLKAWDAAVAERQDWDGYLWLNDDTELNSDTLQKFQAVDDGERIVVGDLANSKGEVVYGLRDGGLVYRQLCAGAQLPIDCVYADIRFVREGATVDELRSAKTVRCVGGCNYLFDMI